MLSLALLLVASSARGLPAAELEAEPAGQSSGLLTSSLPRVGSLDRQALPDGLAVAAGSPIAERRPADAAGAGPLGALGVPAPVPASAPALASRAWLEGLQRRRPAAATPQADVDLQRWAAEAQRRGDALHRHHEEALQEDRHLRAEDARLRREAAALRAAVAAQASPTASPGTSHLSGDAMFMLACLALLILGCCTWAGLQTCGDLRQQASDEKGDGTVSSADVKRSLHQHFLCGLDAHSLRSFCQLLAFAIAGFVFLWWKEMIQPILGSLLVYAFIATVVLLILGIVGGEFFSDFSAQLTQAHEAAKRVEHVFHQGTNDVDEHT